MDCDVFNFYSLSKEDSTEQSVTVTSTKYLYWLKYNQAPCLNAFDRILTCKIILNLMLPSN